MNLDDVLLAKFASIPRITSSTGEFVEMVGGLARVNLQGATVDLKCDGWSPPIPGQSVRVESLDGIMRVTGPAGARSAVGVVTASLDGNTRARVLVDGAEYVLPVMAPYSPLTTDKVVIDWQSGFVLGEQAAVAEPVAPPSTGSGPVGFSNLLVQATWSARWNTGGSVWGDSNVWTGTSTRGGWGYSGRLRALAGANVTRAEIYLPLLKQQNNMSFAVHGATERPGSDPGFSSITAHGGSRSGWVDLPGGWGNWLRDNPTGGVGVLSPGGGNNQWVGVSDPMSGALRFAGTR